MIAQHVPPSVNRIPRFQKKKKHGYFTSAFWPVWWLQHPFSTLLCQCFPKWLISLIRACCVSAKSKLKDTEEELKKLRKDKQQMAEEIGRIKSDLSTAQSKLRSQEVILDERSCALATERSFRQHLEEQLNTKAGDILVTGSSIIRDLDEALYKDTKVIAISGALPKDVTKVLKEEHAKKSKYKRVKLVVGSNQVKENSEKVADTIKDIRQTVKAAQDLAQEVGICVLPPRINSKAATQAIAALNAGLHGLAEETGCNLISTKEAFTLADGEPNDGYIMDDGIHLNERGSSKLVKRLQIPVLNQSTRKVTRMAGYRRTNELYPKNKDAPAAGQQKQPSKGQRKNTPAPTTMVHPKEMQKLEKTNRRRGNTSNNERPEPLCKEDGFCGYCGEPGHRHKECRHGGPVVCHGCQKPTHKEKFCEFYMK